MMGGACIRLDFIISHRCHIMDSLDAGVQGDRKGSSQFLLSKTAEIACYSRPQGDEGRKMIQVVVAWAYSLP